MSRLSVSFCAAIIATFSVPAMALLSSSAPDPAWSHVGGDNVPANSGVNNWAEYVVEGNSARDPQATTANDDSSTGGTNPNGSDDINSGYPNSNVGNCHPAGDTNCGNYASAYWYYYQGDGTTDGYAGVDVTCGPYTPASACIGGSDGVDDYAQDDIMYFRVRVDGNPQAASGDGLRQSHWNFLVDLEETVDPAPNPPECSDGETNPDCFKEIWIDVDGNNPFASSSVDWVRIVYENLQSNTVTNANGAGLAGNACGGGATEDGTGVVVDAFRACYGQVGACATNNTSHTRVISVPNAGMTDVDGLNPGGPAGTPEYFVDVQIPVAALRKNDVGCYNLPNKLSDPEIWRPGSHVLFREAQKLRLFVSTSNSLTDPLQKDYIAPGEFSQVATTPVTIAYTKTRVQGNKIRFEWSTATETRNIGFTLYAVVNGEWIQLNDTPILGALDSQEPRDYEATVANPYGNALEFVGIAGVDLDQIEDRHGPYPANSIVGERTIPKPINWGQIKKETDKALQHRKSAKKSASFVKETANIHVKVTENGLQRITDAQLRAIGVDLSGTRPAHIAVSFRGTAVAREIGGLDKKGQWGRTSWVNFIGQGPSGRDAIYIKANHYQLGVNPGLARPTQNIAFPDLDERIFETNREYQFTSPGDDPWIDSPVIYWKGYKSPVEVRFDLPGLATDEAELDIRLAALSSGDHHLKIFVNGQLVSEQFDSGWRNWPITLQVSGVLQEYGNTLRLEADGAPDQIDWLVYDKLIVNYQSTLEKTAIETELQLAETVTRESLVAGSADLVIVSHPAFMGTTLDNHVAKKESDGWSVLLVDVLDIYEAYGYGMALPQAISDFLDDANHTGYTHVQLVGAASRDYLNHSGVNSVNFIPSVYIDTHPSGESIGYTPCDACFVLDENELPTKAIGRWIVRSEAELVNVINKGEQWVTNSGPGRHALLLADKSESNYDFAYQVGRTASQLDATGEWTHSNVYLDNYSAITDARSNLKEAWEAGSALTLYSGHGASFEWSRQKLLDQSHISGINNAFNPTLALPFTCFTTYADLPATSTLAHQLTAGNVNGAAAVYGAATLSDYNHNREAITFLLDEFLAGETLGESILQSKIRLGNSDSANFRNVILNSNLLGDVTLRLD